MFERDRDYYLRLRREYEPKNIRLVMVAESPPASAKSFYDTTGSAKEQLFAAITLQLGLSHTTKEISLRELQQKCWVIVDATYQQVDKLTKDASHNRDEVIAKDYPLLLGHLST